MNITTKNRLGDTENKLVITSGDSEGGEVRWGEEMKRYKLLGRK